MKSNKISFSLPSWIGKTTVLALVAGLLAACNSPEANQPDVVVVSPSPTTPASPIVTPTVTATPTTTVSPTTTTTTTTTEPIREVVVITETPDRQSLVGRRVEFTNVAVQEVNGDRTFWVGQSNNQRLFVVLDQGLDQGSAEQNVQIKTGQTLDLTGVLQPIPTAQQAQQQWQGLDAAEAQALSNQTVYLQVDKIDYKQAS